MTKTKVGAYNYLTLIASEPSSQARPLTRTRAFCCLPTQHPTLCSFVSRPVSLSLLCGGQSLLFAMPTIADLTPDPKNARTHPERNIRTIAKSLEEVGAARSIVIDEDNVILAGNGLVEAAGMVGIEDIRIVEASGNEIIAVRRTGLTKKQKKRLAVLDNRAGELAEWNPEVLAELTKEIDLSDLFFEDELSALLNSVNADTNGGLLPGADPDAIPEAVETRCKPGDLWSLGRHRLLCGDSTNPQHVEILMDGKKANAVLTDPPYGINREGITNDDPEGLAALFRDVLSILPVQDAVIIAFQSTRLFPVWLDAVRENGHKFERMLWMYKPSDCTFPWRGWLLTSEAILVSTIGNAKWRDVHPYMHDCYSPTTIGKELPEGVGHHASVKPMAVVLDLLQRIEGEIVFDPFLGSGTTLIAAEQLDRICFGMEIEPKYCDVILTRWEQATGKTAQRIE